MRGWVWLLVFVFISVHSWFPTVSCAQNVAIHTFAGSTNAGTTNGFGSNARLNHPAGAAADSSGIVYVADTENSTIRKITADGYASTLAGLATNYGSVDGSGDIARFYGPQALAADSSGQLYVADTGNSTIRQVSVSGSVSTLAGTAGHFNSFDGLGGYAQFYHPEGIAVDPAGNIYVADTWNHTVRVIRFPSQVSTFVGLAGNFGATDGTNSKARFNRPTGIAIDAATNLFVADCFNHTIRKITPSGMVTTIAGLAGAWGSADGTNNCARFYLPQGISVSAGGDLFVSDSGNQTVRKISLLDTNWIVTTVAGASGTGGFANGVGTAAEFDFPCGIATDPAGNVYVADMANNLVRTTRIVPPTLQFTISHNQLILSWPVSADGFVLEQSLGLGASADWSAATNGIVALGDNFVRTNAMNGIALYRLHLP
jgi:sugar lactone lactonase YvrE